MQRITGIALVAVALALGGVWVAAQIGLTEFQPNTPILSADVNANFTALGNAVVALQSQAVVETLNTLSGEVNLVAGSNVTITVDPDTGEITIASTASGSAGGDISAVTAGEGLSGGGDAGDVALAVAFEGPGSAVTVPRSDHDHDTRYYSQAEVDALVATASPSGAVMSFNLLSCPDAWTVYEPAQGRLVVGLNNGGNLGRQVGSRFGDGEERRHQHIVPGDSFLQTERAGDHDHRWVDYTDGRWVSGDGGFFIDWDNGIHGDGAGNYPLAVDNTDAAHFDTSTNGEHRHDLSTFDTLSDSTSTGLPYVQLLMCQKD